MHRAAVQLYLIAGPHAGTECCRLAIDAQAPGTNPGLDLAARGDAGAGQKLLHPLGTLGTRDSGVAAHRSRAGAAAPACHRGRHSVAPACACGDALRRAVAFGQKLVVVAALVLAAIVELGGWILRRGDGSLTGQCDFAGLPDVV